MPRPVSFFVSNRFQHMVKVRHPFRQPGGRQRQSVGAYQPRQNQEADKSVHPSGEQYHDPQQEQQKRGNAEHHAGKQAEEPAERYQKRQSQDNGEQQNLYYNSHSRNLLCKLIYGYTITH